jgi:hypothetical protein
MMQQKKLCIPLMTSVAEKATMKVNVILTAVVLKLYIAMVALLLILKRCTQVCKKLPSQEL